MSHVYVVTVYVDAYEDHSILGVHASEESANRVVDHLKNVRDTIRATFNWRGYGIDWKDFTISDPDYDNLIRFVASLTHGIVDDPSWFCDCSFSVESHSVKD